MRPPKGLVISMFTKWRLLKYSYVLSESERSWKFFVEDWSGIVDIYM